MKLFLIGAALAVALPSAAYAADAMHCCCCNDARDKDCCCDKDGHKADHHEQH